MCGTLGKRLGRDESEAAGVEPWRGDRGTTGRRWRGELVPVKGDYNGKLPETSATAAAKSRRFARGRCAFHLPDSRKHGAACHTAVVFPGGIRAGYTKSGRTCTAHGGCRERDSSPGKLKTLLIH